MMPLVDPPVLCMNKRNALIRRYNLKPAIVTVDDKIRFKVILRLNGIDTSHIIARISSRNQIPKVLSSLRAPCVIKPAHGRGGAGIMMLNRKYRGKYIISGEAISRQELTSALLRILAGNYSDGYSDEVLIEEKIITQALPDELSKYGPPDIRTFVFDKTVIAAMIRVPSDVSDGKANISQGANAYGIDIDSGEVVAQGNTFIIPHWKDIRENSIRACELSGLRMAGVDTMLSQRGPLIIECNARPGLEIQNITGIDLWGRIKELDENI